MSAIHKTATTLRTTEIALFGVVIASTHGFAQTQPYQHKYQEEILQPVPVEFAKVKDRLGNWKARTRAEIQSLKTSTHPRIVAWRNAILTIKADNDHDFLIQINKITNHAVQYRDDYDHYGKDYWAAPIATLIQGGDCEDIALLKAVALYLHGWDVTTRAHILIGHVYMDRPWLAHAVLQISDSSQKAQYILRSINDDVLTFDDMESVFRPIYMMNEQNLILFRASNSPSDTAPSPLENTSAGTASIYNFND